jgi:hypothetical protein
LGFCWFLLGCGAWMRVRLLVLWLL